MIARVIATELGDALVTYSDIHAKVPIAGRKIADLALSMGDLSKAIHAFQNFVLESA